MGTKQIKKKKALVIALIAVVIIIIGSFITINSVKGITVKKNIEAGSKYFQEEKYEEAALAFEKVIEVEPKNMSVRLQLAEVYIMGNKNIKALDILKEIILLDKTNYKIYFVLADLYMKDKKYTEAIKVYEQGILDSEDKEMLQKNLDDLRKSINVSEINVTLEKNQKFELPKDVEVSIYDSKHLMPVKWEVDGVDTSLEKSQKIQGKVEVLNKPVILNIQFKKPVPIEKELNLSKAERDDIGLFLSNFTELNLNKFDINSYSADEVIRFGIWHNVINNWNTLESSPGDESYIKFINKKYVEQSIKKYFNLNFKDHKTVRLDANNPYTFTGEGYKFTMADGNMVEYVRVMKVVDIGEGQLKVSGTLYYPDMPEQGTSGSVKATISKKENKYSLINLSVVKD